MTDYALHLQSISHAFGTEVVLENITFSLQKKTSVALVGTSGSGKSTLLHIAGLLTTPTRGSVFIDGTDVSALSDKKRAQYRNLYIGFIYQFHNLLPEFTVLENVLFPMWVANRDTKTALRLAQGLLQDVDMLDFKDKRASALSGGQSQRVAIARALANTPKLVLADEPTGNLDDHNSIKVWQLLVNLVKKHGSGLLCVTHDRQLANKTDGIIKLSHHTLAI